MKCRKFFKTEGVIISKGRQGHNVAKSPSYYRSSTVGFPGDRCFRCKDNEMNRKWRFCDSNFSACNWPSILRRKVDKAVIASVLLFLGLSLWHNLQQTGSSLIFVMLLHQSSDNYKIGKMTQSLV